jgi:probable DNA metabolism protein
MIDMNYLYDGSYEGFLSCVYRHYYAASPEGRAEGIYVADGYVGDLLRASVFIETDEEKADAVSAAIEKKISSYDLLRVYHVFRTKTPEKEMKLLRYIRLGFKRGGDVGLLHGDAVVSEILAAERKLANEVHRLCGLIRFSVMSGDVLYSRIEPDHEVLEFLAPHFTDRFHSDPFIIHDIKRKKALVARNREWYITDLNYSEIFSKAESEDEVRKLWRGYFDAMAIRERTNPRCQRNLMPVRYWKHLTEMRGE